MVGLVRWLCIRSYSAVKNNLSYASDTQQSLAGDLSRFKHFWQRVCGVALDTAPNWGPRERFIVCCQLLQLMRVASSRLINNENRLTPRAVSTECGLDYLVV